MLVKNEMIHYKGNNVKIHNHYLCNQEIKEIKTTSMK